MYRLSNSSFKSKLLCRVAYSESKLFFPLSRCYTIIRSYLQSGFLPCYSVYYSVIHVLSQHFWNFSFHAADTWIYTSLWSSIIWSSHCSWVPSNSQHPGTFFSWFKSYLWLFHSPGVLKFTLFQWVWLYKTANTVDENFERICSVPPFHV